MPKCCLCEREAELSYNAIEVLTFHIREMSGHRRIQGIGDCIAADVCRECAERYLDEVKNPYRKIPMKIYCMALLTAAGIGMMLRLSAYGFIFVSGGGFFALGGILYIAGYLKSIADRKKAYASLTDDEVIHQAGWDRLVEKLPRKAGENNITYIPINRETMRRKNGDLMVLYKLLPENAVEIHKMIHQDFDMQANPKDGTAERRRHV